MATASQNVLDIVIRGTDMSGGAINKASNAAKQLKKDMDAVGKVFGSVGSVVGMFNAELGHAVNAVTHFITTSKQMQGELGNSKIAMAALGVAAVGTGFAIGTMLYDFLTRNDAKKTADQIELLSIRLRAMNSLINDPRGKAINQIDNEVELQIKRIELMKVSESEKAAAIAAVRKAQELEKVKVIQDANAKISGWQQEAAEKEKKIVQDLNAFADESNKKKFDDIAKAKQEFNEFVMEIKNSVATESQAADMLLQERMTKVQEFYQMGAITDAQAHKAIETAWAIHQAELSRIEKEQSEKRRAIMDEEKKRRLQNLSTTLSSTASIFGSLATIAETQGKKGFEFAQALRYAEAVINTAAGVARALAEYQWPYSIVVGAAVAAAGAAQIATIASAKPPPAHGGASYIPEETTYLLNKGERVLSPRQNEDLTSFMSQGGGGGGDLYIDGTKFGKWLYGATKSGQVKISRRAMAA